MPGPAGLANCVRWYAADTLALSHAAPVTSWPDLSGNGADLTPISAAPVYANNRWNAMPGVLFAGDQSRALANSSATGRPTGDLTIAAVVANGKRGSFPQFVAWGSGSTQGFSLYGNSGADTNGQPPAFIVLRGSGSWGDNLATATVIPSRLDPVILTGRSTGATTKIRVDIGNEIDATGGDTGSISYGSSPILTIGDKGPGNGIMMGIVYEVVIFDALLGATDLATLEAYLDGKWRVTQSAAQFYATFDGTDGITGLYGVGMGWSPEGTRWKQNFNNPVVSEGDGTKDPYTFFDDALGVWVMYCSVYDGSNYKIWRLTSTDHESWTPYASNPVIGLGPSGSGYEGGVAFPVVRKDLLEPDPTRRFKMWAALTTGTPDIFTYTIGYFTSADGFAWTFRGIVVPAGSSGSWNAAGIAPGDVYQDPATLVYDLLVQGRKNSSPPNDWTGGVFTFTNPEGTYTAFAGNPTILNNGASQALTVDCLVGDLVVHVADTSAFSQGDAVVLARSTLSGNVPSVNRILTVDSSTQMTLEWSNDDDYPVLDSAQIIQHWHTALVPRSILPKSDGTFDLFMTPLQPTPTPLREACLRVNVPTLTSTPNPGGHLLLGMLLDQGKWNRASTENFRVVSAAPSNQIGLITFPPSAPFGSGFGPRS